MNYRMSQVLEALTNINQEADTLEYKLVLNSFRESLLEADYFDMASSDRILHYHLGWIQSEFTKQHPQSHLRALNDILWVLERALGDEPYVALEQWDLDTDVKLDVCTIEFWNEYAKELGEG